MDILWVFLGVLLGVSFCAFADIFLSRDIGSVHDDGGRIHDDGGRVYDPRYPQ